jgi:hypothetical protein
MKRSKFSEEQIAYALRQVEQATPVGDVCRDLGVSEASGRTASATTSWKPVAGPSPWSSSSPQTLKIVFHSGDLQHDHHCRCRTSLRPCAYRSYTAQR